MLKSQLYYFEDIVFQLELNLQSIRRELIKLLDECHHSECFTCNRLRCCCGEESFSIDSGRISDEGGECGDIEFSIQSPPPCTLPIPEWRTNRQFSIDKSKIQFNPDSIWDHQFGWGAIERPNRLRERDRNSVDVFFGYFSKKGTEGRFGYF